MGYKSPWPWPPSPLIIFIFIFIVFTFRTTSYSSNPPPLPLPLPPSPRSPPPPPNPNPTLKPSMTIVVGVLTTVFSITFLLLLYAKHCRRPEESGGGAVAVRGGYAADRENSGIDRTIIESLPVFRFGSLSGQKDGLECAVCLARFDPSEVLRLLPKCKHAFHIECVDTWLDAHSTCPLCRYRVDPEDIFLVFGENEISRDIARSPPPEVVVVKPEDADDGGDVALRRVSGRHSSVEPSSSASAPAPAGSRRSLDSWKSLKKAGRRSKKKEEAAPMKAVTSSNDHRKDGMLLAEPVSAEEEEGRRRSRSRRRRSFEKRFEHRIVVGAQRWSDVQPSDLLYLRSEMILSDVRRSRRSRPSVLHEENNGWWQRSSGRDVINSRSVSEMTGLSRFGSNEMLSRWLAWRPEPKSKPPVLQSEPNSCSSNV